jgi:hypothetical protein
MPDTATNTATTADISTLEALEELVTSEALSTLGKSFDDAKVSAIFQHRFKPGTNTHNGWEVIFNYHYGVVNTGDTTGKPTPVVNPYTGKDVVIRLGKVTKFDKALPIIDAALCDLKTAIDPIYQ